ncbi:type IV pili methyl-accepting chemotaxis transducer N-terminal domain-containing protein [Pontivivens ytuae]|uniref:Type IV pili methyl-accepting chemotaxis transducer N-terminal domain-containing protein n=1 Tax=Pontivivens ytuae TaxID=2789856 RepID=A0A7S9QCN5_9RHOB|nr:type IV pili methyl-accepting chemotaxis transducer N-terminal domain-containing protein [Pontivivens ytuae]QPH53286.1 type IV pili methyl-accepting chemotaxis transducer N-terminal domain-containing protein [Pontivivens ytuae]
MTPRDSISNVLLVAALAIGVPTGASADTTSNAPVTAEEAAYRVNVAGRQRMLSQRMAKAACLASTGIATETHLSQLDAAYDLFQRSDAALRVGDPDFNLPAERYQSVLTALSEIDGPWRAYGRMIDTTIADGSIEEERLMVLDAASVEVLDRMNAAVNRTARAYGDAGPRVPLALTVTVDIAGRQRMLTQRAVKEVCLMQVADNPQDYADRLTRTVEIFDLSLAALQNGLPDAGVLAAPNEEIAGQLAEVDRQWQAVHGIFDRAAAGEVLDADTLADLADRVEPLLAAMHAAVGMYEGVDATTGS